MRFLLCCLLSLSSVFLPAQTLDYVPGEIIVQFGADVEAKVWLTAKAEITRYERLSPTLNIYRVNFDHGQHAYRELRRKWWPDPAVQALQTNRPLHPRARPNDPSYDRQWQHLNAGQIGGLNGADHNPEPAWDVTTGGVTANGDTIVVAVIDDGIDLDHEDLAPNLWVNCDEIPGNGIDDDNNGYVDDIHGFNTVNNTGNVDAGTLAHGTPVAGLIGAKGNNSIGVAGMNWDVKLMVVKNNLVATEASAIAAYAYALEAKRSYLESDGERGAYVVATNVSWGTNFGQAEDSPIWCGLYDELGKVGILNAGATTNDELNVDIVGDLPTTCPSDYLLSVTNLLGTNMKKDAAGFGRIHIDLGAFGEDVFTTTLGNSYGAFNGTSAATPSVAGAIALLFAAPCANFGELLEADPARAALRVRRAILNNVTHVEDLEGITVTEGRLDVGKAMAELMANGADPTASGNASCNACFAPTSFTAAPTAERATSLTLDWRAAASITNVTVRYRVSGTTIWTELADATAPLTIDGLSACVGYDVQLVGNCGSTAVESEVLTTSTDGCCVIPPDWTVSAEPNTFFVISWTDLLAARFYRIRYRKVGEADWLTRTAARSPFTLAGLEPCMDYEFEFRTDCDTLVTDFGGSTVITSTGCGSCNEADYCVSDNYNNTDEWIGRVDLGNGLLVNASGRDEGGYASFGEIGEETLVRGGKYSLSLLGRARQANRTQEFVVYIDWNQDGFFSRGELMAEVKTTNDVEAHASFTVPFDADTLLTRMRVIMQDINVSGGSCARSRVFGEAEDYCVRISEAKGCPAPLRLNATYDADANLTTLDWRASAAVGGDYRLRYRLRDSQEAWTEIDLDTTVTTISGLNLCGAYEVDIASLCADGVGEYRRFYFNEVCTSADTPELAEVDWAVFPNPAATLVNVRYTGASRVEALRIFDLQGRELRKTTGVTSLRVADLPAGIYLLRLTLADGRSGVRRVVIR